MQCGKQLNLQELASLSEQVTCAWSDLPSFSTSIHFSLSRGDAWRAEDQQQDCHQLDAWQLQAKTFICLPFSDCLISHEFFQKNYLSSTNSIYLFQGRPEDKSRVSNSGKRFLNSDGFKFHYVFIANMTVIRFQIKEMST